MLLNTISLSFFHSDCTAATRAALVRVRLGGLVEFSTFSLHAPTLPPIGIYTLPRKIY